MNNLIPQETVQIGEISSDEFRLVKSAVDFVKFDSSSQTGPLIKCMNGRRVWQVASDDAVVTVFGETCDFEGIYLLGSQFITNCVPLFKIDENVRLSIDDRKITAISPAGTLTMPCGPMVDNFVSTSQINTVFAHLPFKHLFRAIDTASDLPGNISFHAMKQNDDPPPTSISVGNGQLKCRTNWKPHGSQSVETSAKASTLGEGEISACAQTLNRLINVFNTAGNPEFTVAFNPLANDFIEFSTTNCRLAVRRKLTGSDLLLKQIREKLTGLFQKHTVSDHGTIAAIIEDCPIRISLLKSESSDEIIIRLTHTVMRGAVPTIDLLKEINIFNQQLVRTRTWLEENRVIIGIDLETDDVESIYQNLLKLAADSRKLDGVLEPLGA